VTDSTYPTAAIKNALLG
jgi:hypothetical protein